MKSEWKRATIGDCCYIEKNSIIPISGIEYTCFSLPAFDNGKQPEILKGEDIKSSKFILMENTILFNKLNPKFRRVWNIHNLEKKRNAICSTEFLPLKTVDSVEQDFLYYYIYSKEFTKLMNGIRTGTSNSQQRIDWRLFLRQPILLPSIETQQKIARYLGMLDEKIELNNEVNKNLTLMISRWLREHWSFDIQIAHIKLPLCWRIRV